AGCFDLGVQGCEDLARLRVYVLDEVVLQLPALDLAALGGIELEDRQDVRWRSGNPALGGILGPGRERIILRRHGGATPHAGLVPINRAVELREGPAADLRAGIQPNVGRRNL